MISYIISIDIYGRLSFTTARRILFFPVFSILVIKSWNQELQIVVVIDATCIKNKVYVLD